MLTKILMGAQYELPLSENPFVELAEKIKVDKNYLLRELKAKKIIKRIGVDVNYRALRNSCGALVGIMVPFGKIKLAAEVINKFNPKHNFWRDHWKYNVWFTVKARNKNELEKIVRKISEKLQCKDYVFLPTKRIYRMSVKYDLVGGISLSSGRIEPDDVTKIEEIGVNESLLKSLSDIPISERPFSKFEKYGYSESEIVDLIAELMSKGIVRDFFATLNEKKVGFKVNCMFAAKLNSSEDSFLIKIVRKHREITHMIKREVDKNWNYELYFMLHAKEKKILEEKGNEILRDLGAERFVKLYSIADLRNFDFKF